jgi:hypothetical protein
VQVSIPQPASQGTPGTAARPRVLATSALRLLARRQRVIWLAGLLAALALTTPAWLSWLDPRLNLWEVDDAKNHMIRIYHITWLIERGVWHPRWVPDMFMGFGYPVLNYYAPAMYYVAWGMGRLLQLDVWDAFRAAGVVAALTGAAGVYALATALWRRPILGILAAVTLLYGPYVFQINLFKRGDLPEALALALIPWLLLGLLNLWQARTPRQTLLWLAATTAAGAAIVLSHNLTAMLAAAVAAVWVAYLFLVRPGWSRLGRVVLAGAMAVGLTAFFWLPAIGESDVVQLEALWTSGGLDYRGWFIEPDGRSPRHQAPDNRQTRTGLIDLHLHYPHQLVAPPKLSLGQAGLGLLVVATLGIGAARSLRRSFTSSSGRGGRMLFRRPAWRPAWRRLSGPTVAVPARADSSSPMPSQGQAPWAEVPLFVVALGCWYLTFARSAPVWEAVPGLPLLQFPWRLLGPLGICLALAAAGALAGPLAAMERRWGHRGWWLGQLTVAAIGALVLVNHVGDREVQFVARPERPVDGRTVVADEIKDLPGVGTTSNREFLPRQVYIATYTVGYPRGRNVAERLYPEAEWLGGLLHPLAGDLRILGWRAAPLRIGVRVANDGEQPAQLAFRQLAFPGWRGWLDGQPIPVELAPYVPEQQAALGFMVLTIPPGEHTVNLAFGPSPVRLLALGITLATCLLIAGAVALGLHRARRLPPGQALLAWAALVALPVYLTWRGVWPMFGPLVAHPVSAARPLAGVWQAPDLPAGQSTLLVNLAEAARTAQARIDTPSGAILGRDKHADVRQLTVSDVDPDRGLAGTSRRQWLYLHPPSSVSVDVTLPAGRTAWFQAGLTLDPEAWSSPVGDGARFQVSVTPLEVTRREGPPTIVLDQTINPRAQERHRRWVPVEADLSPWAGRTVRLTLHTSHGADPTYDWAGWGNPVVVVRETDRTRPPVSTAQ